MRTKITLGEFLYVLNQDEDMRVTLADFDKPYGENITNQWKRDLINDPIYAQYKDWLVQDFTLAQGGIEIVITKSKLED